MTQNWFPDSGVTHHITLDLSNFNQYGEYKGHDQLQVGNGQGLAIYNTGISSFSNSSHQKFNLKDILHVPSITKNLLSVQKFALDNNVFFEFHPYHFLVKDRATKTLVLSGTSSTGLYTLPIKRRSSTSPSAHLAVKPSFSC